MPDKGRGRKEHMVGRHLRATAQFYSQISTRLTISKVFHYNAIAQGISRLVMPPAFLLTCPTPKMPQITTTLQLETTVSCESLSPDPRSVLP